MKTFIVDIEKCNGCYACQLACKDENVGNAWLPYSEPEPSTGQLWLKMFEKTHGQVPKVRVEYYPKMCRHCEDAPCIDVAPDCVYRREDGLVIIDPVKSKGRGEIIESCPYHMVYWNEELSIPQKCTGCAHLVDEGALPHCVEACVTGALRFGDASDFADEIEEDTGAHVIGSTKPIVHYLHPFGLFISGEVWDEQADLIIEDAVVRIVGQDGTTMTTRTDGFGDFWFKHLKPGKYTLSIEVPGYVGIDDLEVELFESLNIGDFPLTRA